MASIWDYEGSRVVVAGGGGGGMGAAAVTELAAQGAEVHVIDLKTPPVDVAGYYDTDLRDPDAVSQTVATIDGEINALVLLRRARRFDLPRRRCDDGELLVGPPAGRARGAAYATGERDCQYLVDRGHRLDGQRRKVDAPRDDHRLCGRAHLGG